MGSVCAVAHPTHLAHQTQWALLCVYTTNIRRKEESCFFFEWLDNTNNNREKLWSNRRKKKIWWPSRETLFLFRHHRTHNSFVWLLWSVISYLLQLFIVLFRWDDEENAQIGKKSTSGMKIGRQHAEFEKQKVLTITHAKSYILMYSLL